MANEVMTVTDFQKTSEYLGLTENQKTWILKLVATNDPRQATTETYPKARKLGAPYTSQLAGKLLHSPSIRAALAKFYGWSSKEIFLRDLDAQISKAKKGSSNLVSLMALKARMLGLVPGDASIDAGTFGSAHEARTPETPKDVTFTVAQKPTPKDPYAGYDEMSRKIFGH